jgi:hypothetical protein
LLLRKRRGPVASDYWDRAIIVANKNACSSVTGVSLLKKWTRA